MPQQVEVIDAVRAGEHPAHHAGRLRCRLGRRDTQLVLEQVIAELKDGPLAHLPSGKYTANAAWVACAVIAFNIARAAAVATDLAKARWATLRREIIKVPGRIASTARRLDLHLPIHGPWTPGGGHLHAAATDPPIDTTS